LDFIDLDLMELKDVLKPKSKGKISELLEKFIENSPNLPEFIFEYEIEKYFRVLKAYDYIATKLLKESPKNLFMIYGNNKLYDKINMQLNNFFYTNIIREKINFTGGPFSHALVWKPIIAMLQGGTYNTFLISKKNILNILTN